MSQHLFNDTDITAIANAIRTKKGTQNTMTVSQMPSEIASIPSGGGTDYMAQRVQGTLSSYTIPNTCTRIEGYSFWGQPISSITIPNTITQIGTMAFYLTRLTSITIPSSVTRISNSAFYNCELISVTFDSNLYANFEGSIFASNNQLTTLNNFSIGMFKPKSSSSTLPYIPRNLFDYSALVGDISLGTSAEVGTRAFYNDHSNGMLYIHLTQNDTSLLASSYSFENTSSSYSTSPFNLSHCKLVVPYSADHSILTAYQTQWPNYSTIMIEEAQ